MDVYHDYHYNGEAEQYSFYRLPKAFFTNDEYKTLSDSAKILYGLMLDRMGLSRKNGWFDDDGRIFIHFTLEEAMEYMNCSQEKCSKLYAELDTNKFGLIERVRQGQGKPAKIYVKKFVNVTTDNQKSRLRKNHSQDYGKTVVKTTEKPYSRVPKNRSQEYGKTIVLPISKTDMSNTESNQSIYQDENQPQDMIDEMDFNEYQKLISENIEYDYLIHHSKFANEPERIDGIIDLMLDTICSNRPFLYINSQKISTEIVKSRLLKLNAEHIEYVLNKLENTTADIGNIRAYTLTALYNSTFSMYEENRR